MYADEPPRPYDEGDVPRRAAAIEFRFHFRVPVIAVAAIALAGCSVSATGPSAPASDRPTSSESRPSESSEEPDPTEQDRARDIEGIVITEYDAVHALPGQRVRYDRFPPDGGRHDPTWANCMGAIYDVPVRNEHMVHSLEHGAVWIAYDPDRVAGADLAALEERVADAPYMMLSPYPGLDEPISLQAWGHQLKLRDADDPRVDEFIAALRENRYTAPEPGAPCDTDPGFDVANPPPFEPGPPPPDAAPVGNT